MMHIKTEEDRLGFAAADARGEVKTMMVEELAECYTCPALAIVHCQRCGRLACPLHSVIIGEGQFLCQECAGLAI